MSNNSVVPVPGWVKIPAAPSPPATVGICACGCGGRTSLALQTRSALGIVAGEPNKFILGHSSVFARTGRAAGIRKDGNREYHRAYREVKRERLLEQERLRRIKKKAERDSASVEKPSPDLRKPTGFCFCGCGRRTNIVKYDNPAQGNVKGEPYRWIKSHSASFAKTGKPCRNTLKDCSVSGDKRRAATSVRSRDLNRNPGTLGGLTVDENVWDPAVRERLLLSPREKKNARSRRWKALNAEKNRARNIIYQRNYALRRKSVLRRTIYKIKKFFGLD